MSDRRDFLKKAGLLGLAGIASKLVSNDKINALENFGAPFDQANAFSLPKLPYAYNALEPFIDAKTMEIHYTKHHQAYVNKLNETPSTNLDYGVDDMAKCKSIDASTSPVIRNNLGGHVNHSLFWTLLKPALDTKTANVPTGKLAEAINKDFSSFDEFKKQFSEKATKHFGSGWCWLIKQGDKLVITTTPNQDNPLMKVAEQQGDIVMALDVWEHAYYLKYQNKRADYITSWWNVANWDKAGELFAK
jgi:Fe-Mn family superoxide dismutase